MDRPPAIWAAKRDEPLLAILKPANTLDVRTAGTSLGNVPVINACRVYAINSTRKVIPNQKYNIPFSDNKLVASRDCFHCARPQGAQPTERLCNSSLDWRNQREDEFCFAPYGISSDCVTHRHPVAAGRLRDRVWGRGELERATAQAQGILAWW